MARKVYKPRNRPVRRRLRGKRMDENARPSRRRRAGKTDAEQERLRAGEKGAEDSAVAERGEDRLDIEKPEADVSRCLFHRAEAAEAPTVTGKTQKQRRRLRHSAEETRDASETQENSDNLQEGDAGERENFDHHPAGDPVVRERRAQFEPGNARKQRQRRQANSFRQAGKDAGAAAESFEKIADAEIKRTSEIASAQRRSRLKHSDEGNGMAHGAGRLARKTAALAGAAAIQPAKRGRSGAEEDNAAVEAAHSGAAAQAAARHSVPHRKRIAVPNATPICAKTRCAGKRTFAPNPRNQRKTRRRPNTEKRSASSLSRKRSVNARLPGPGEKSPSSRWADLPARQIARSPRRRRQRKPRSPSFPSTRAQSLAFALPGCSLACSRWRCPAARLWCRAAARR